MSAGSPSKKPSTRKSRSTSKSSATRSPSAGAASTSRSPSPASSQGSGGGGQSLEQMFQHFASFGDRDCQGTITLKNIDKWWEQAHLFGKTITHADTAIYFSKVARNKKRVDLEEFKVFLQTVAEYKNMDVSELISKLQTAGGPRLSKHTEPVRNSKVADNMDRLTDTSKYTGSHKARFDESGHGKGLAGRYEVVDNEGYVTGYKNKDTYGKDAKDDDDEDE